MFTKNELYLAHGAINQNIKDVKVIFRNEYNGLTDEESLLLTNALPKMINLKNKIAEYINKFDICHEAKEVYVFKITFFYRNGDGHESVTLPKPKFMQCTRDNLLAELHLTHGYKSGMIMFEYFLSEQSAERFMNSEDEDYEPSIDCIFTEPV